MLRPAAANRSKASGTRAVASWPTRWESSPSTAATRAGISWIARGGRTIQTGVPEVALQFSGAATNPPPTATATNRDLSRELWI